MFYEDHEYATFPCSKAKSILPLDLFIYEYRIGDVTQSVSAANQLKRIGHTETVLKRMTAEGKSFTGGGGALLCEENASPAAELPCYLAFVR